MRIQRKKKEREDQKKKKKDRSATKHPLVYIAVTDNKKAQSGAVKELKQV